MLAKRAAYLFSSKIDLIYEKYPPKMKKSTLDKGLLLKIGK
jgi:hypothetical protein